MQRHDLYMQEIAKKFFFSAMKNTGISIPLSHVVRKLSFKPSTFWETFSSRLWVTLSGRVSGQGSVLNTWLLTSTEPDKQPGTQLLHPLGKCANAFYVID